MTTDRIHNFSAGPAVLPLEVLQKAQAELLNFKNSGMSVMEMSHRSKEFEAVIQQAEASVRELLNVPDDYAVLFLQGGASTQFSMVPMNLLQEGKPAEVVTTGSWTKKAITEIKKVGACKVVASSDDKNFSYIPKNFQFSQDASFAYITSNNTIAGTQWKTFPNTGSLPLVADMSSDIFSKPFDIKQFGLVFAGAQKNLGPSGVTLVIVKKDLVQNPDANLPTMMQYKTHIENDSMYNTPPTFAIYILNLVLEWIKSQGGLAGIQKHNEEKAQLLYDAIDDADFYLCPVAKEDRSLMNVVFRIQNNEELEAKFVKEATAAGLSGLKGHRSVGGLRASIYNACSKESVQALVAFMAEFKKKNLVQKAATLA